MDHYIVECAAGAVPQIVTGASFRCTNLISAPDVLLTYGDYQGILLLCLGAWSLAWCFRALCSLLYRVK